MRPNFYRLPELKRLIDRDDDGAKKIRDRILRGKGEGQTTDPETGQDGGNIITQTLDREQQAQHHKHGD